MHDYLQEYYLRRKFFHCIALLSSEALVKIKI
jgi:hypothetical protein